MNWPARFWAKVAKSDGCWEWRGSRNLKGYGWVGVPGGQVKLAHRASWVLSHGELSPKACVLHRCDNPGCVRPDHLFLGTHAENMADMTAKGRQFRGEARSNLAKIVARRGEEHWTKRKPELVPCGESNSRAELTETDVRQIIATGRSVSSDDLAARFGVSRTAINHVLAGRTWRHVDAAIARERLQAESQGLTLRDVRAGQQSLFAEGKS